MLITGVRVRSTMQVGIATILLVLLALVGMASTPSAAQAVPPVCADQFVTLDEDDSVMGQSISGACDPGLDFSLGNSPNNQDGPTGFSFNDLGKSFDYAPYEDYFGPDSFTVNAIDSGTFEMTQFTVNITVTGTEDVPDCVPTWGMSINEDQVGDLDMTYPCLDPDGDVLTFTVHDDATHGTVEQTDDALFTYTPDQDYDGTDDFTIDATDGKHVAVNVDIPVTILSANDAPVCTPVTLTVAEDTIVTPVDYTGKCTDPEGDSIDFNGFGSSLHGNFNTTSATGGEYYASQNYNGSDTYTVVASDGHGGTANLAINITVTPVPDTLDCSGAQVISTPEDTPLTNVAFSCTDPDGPITWETTPVAPGPTHGAITINAVTRTFTYTPADDYAGADTFYVRAHEGGVQSDMALAITMTAVNDAPDCTPGAKTIVEDTADIYNAFGNCVDVESDPISYAIQAQPNHGSLAAAGIAGTFDYTPEADYAGLATFQLRATDNHAAHSDYAVNLTITPVDDAVTCTASWTETTPEDTARTVVPPCSDIDGPGSITYTVSAQPLHGQMDGLVYTPAAEYGGTDSVGLIAHSGVTTQFTMLTITVTPVNDPPTCTAATLAAVHAVPATLQATCSDVDTATLAFRVSLPPSFGTATVTPAGGITYTTSSTFIGGVDGFTVEASDGTSVATSRVGVAVGRWLLGSALADIFNGTSGNDLFHGGGGNDRLAGLGGNDRLYGDAGNDTGNGGAGSDLVDGGPGNDSLIGGPGKDTISGGAGNDKINSRDGKGGDKVTCGKGRDTVRADKGDRIAKDCERVS